MAASSRPLLQVAPDVFRLADTCNVYLLRSGTDGVLIDVGSGAVLDRLGEVGVGRVTDVLVTHHHRDQVQGLPLAVAHGARVWVPPVERDLIAAVDAHWRSRELDNDYSLRQDRFSLLEPVPVTGTVREYRTQRFGELDVWTLPTPGHTVGSVTFLVRAGNALLGFSGDLLYGPGKVWSLAATQWTYTGWEGEAATILSCLALADQAPDLLLPSHGEPIDDPRAALELTSRRLGELVEMRRGSPWDLAEWLRSPWHPVTPHLLRNRTSIATGYALLSETGAALLVDFGYDLTTGFPLGSDRATRRPLLASISALRRDHGVERVEAVIPTHYHDDHVAGVALLREVEGTEVWCHEHVRPVLEDPQRFDLPCLWYDPIPVDRSLPDGVPFRWHEYTLTAHALPGHTLFAAAIELEVDGRKVLATGDQENGSPTGEGLVLNYQYRNRFHYDDFTRSAELYRALQPDLFVSGHHGVHEVLPRDLEALLAAGQRLAELHRELLPVEEVDLGAVGFCARIEPYRSRLRPGEELAVEVAVRNPFGSTEVAQVEFVLPEGWLATPPALSVELAAHEEGALRFTIAPDGRRPAARRRIAVDVTVANVPFGQQAEALVDLA